MMVSMRVGYNATINETALIDVENGDNEGARSTFLAQIVQVLRLHESKRILGLITYNLVIIYYLCKWVTSTNSIALSAYANTTCFNVFALLVCLISVWVEKNSPANRIYGEEPRAISIPGHSRFSKSSGYSEYRGRFDSPSRTVETFRHEKFGRFTLRAAGERNKVSGEAEVLASVASLGLEKYEVLALLVSSCLTLVTGSLISVQLVARLSNQPRVHTGRLGLGALLGLLAHLGTIIGYPDAGLNHVVCKALPCPTLRGCNPILGGNMMSALILSGTHLVVHFWEIHVTDTAAAFLVLGLTAVSMLPLAFHTLGVILQKMPRRMSEELNACLREALIIDGVLEFRNEMFWTKSFGKLAGSLQVRVRRDANENRVLENVTLRLSKIVSTLTIREFRESRTSRQISGHRHLPAEYYIDEILHGKSIDDGSCRTYYRDFGHDIGGYVSLSSCSDAIVPENTKIVTFPVQSEKIKVPCDRRAGRRTRMEAFESSTNDLTILKNDNILMRNYLWRGNAKNALLSGTSIHIESVQPLFVPRQNSNR